MSPRHRLESRLQAAPAEAGTPAPVRPAGTTTLNEVRAMATRQSRTKAAPGPEKPALTKKDQILALFAGGFVEVDDLAVITNSRPSYVAGVLQENNLLAGYFDLYTSTRNPMN